MVLKTCCVTGHRDIPADKIEFIKRELRREVEQALADGYNHFISGFAQGVDLLFAEIVAEVRKKDERIGLEAALPYRNRFYRLMDDERTARILMSCNIIGVHSETSAKGSYDKRNRYMVSISRRLIAVHDGRKTGGTASTMRMATKMEREIRPIRY